MPQPFLQGMGRDGGRGAFDEMRFRRQLWFQAEGRAPQEAKRGPLGERKGARCSSKPCGERRVHHQTHLSSGSLQTKSHMGPSCGTSCTRSKCLAWSSVSIDGLRPPWRQKICTRMWGGGGRIIYYASTNQRARRSHAALASTPQINGLEDTPISFESSSRVLPQQGPFHLRSRLATYRSADFWSTAERNAP